MRSGDSTSGLGWLAGRDDLYSVQDSFDVFESNWLGEYSVEPGLLRQCSVSLVRMAGDRHDLGASECRKLAKLLYKMTPIHVRHGEVDEHQIGPKCCGNVECLTPAIGHMHLVAKCFHDQAQGISTVSVVINDEYPEYWLGRRHQVVFCETDARISLIFMKSVGLTKW